MAKQTEAQKRAVIKYRSSKAKQLRVQYTVEEYAMLEAYCKHINSHIGSFIHKLVRDTIASDPTFTYNSEDKENQDDDSSL